MFARQHLLDFSSDLDTRLVGLALRCFESLEGLNLIRETSPRGAKLNIPSRPSMTAWERTLLRQRQTLR